MGFLDRFQRKSVNDGPLQTSEEALADLREYAVEAINPGFRTMDEVLEIVQDSNEDSETPLASAVVEQLVHELWNVRQDELQRADAEAAGRPDDYSRLLLAFETLETQGIVARMNFTCCQNCGHTEIQDERQPGKAETGYVFFHQQDIDRLTEKDAQLYFAFGPYRESLPVEPGLFESAKAGNEDARSKIDLIWDEAEVTIGRSLANALTAQGFTVEWDGTTAQRPSIMITDWRKPLPA